MMGRVWLAYILIVIVGFVALESYGYFKFGVEGTLSYYTRVWSHYHPLIPFAMGLLVGSLMLHFWSANQQG